MNTWHCLVITLATENATARMRAWRALKASGAAVLRDGVYLIPDRPPCAAELERIAAEVRTGGGTAWLLRVEEPAEAGFATLFDRSEDYAQLLTEIAGARSALSADTLPDVLKLVRKLRKSFAGLAEIDFFPGAERQHVDTALQDLELATARLLSPDDPHAMTGALRRLDVADFRGRTWATRRRPWVDRLACAWLIRRFIDPQARILWIASPADCPPDALGFDFDGASFSHVGARVSFETLLASFGLEQPALLRLGALVHYLDVGGVQPPEAAGVESVLGGLRDAIADDDQLFTAAAGIFDGLFSAFGKGEATP